MRISRKVSRLAAGLMPLALVSCGQLQPVDIPDRARLFVPVPQSSANEQAMTECPGAEQYAAGLGQLMCTADSRRLELLKQAARVTNDVALFNSLSWPIGSAIIYEKLRDPSTRLLLPASVATALYGFFNSGIPGRDAAHRAAVLTLTCGILQYTPYLYKKVEFDGEDTATSTGSPGLQQAIESLETAREAFWSEGGRVLRGLEVRPSVAGSRPDSIGQRTGQTASGGRRYTSPEPHLRAWIERQVAVADQYVALATDLNVEVLASGKPTGLGKVIASVESVREADIASKRPALVSPKDRGAEIATGINALIGQSGSAASGRLTLIEGTPLQSLTKASSKDWAAFENGSAVTELSKAEVRIGRWLTGFRRAQRLSVEARQEVGCPLSAAVRQAAGAPAPSASSPAATPATPNETPLAPAPRGTS